MVADDTETKTGTVGEKTVAVAKTYVGFTAKAFDQITLSGGTEEQTVKIYYDANLYSVTFDPDNGSEADIQQLKYGVALSEPTAPIKDSYTFIGWALKLPDGTYATTAYDFTDKTVDADIAFKAMYIPVTKVSYTVEHYKQTGTNADGEKTYALVQGDTQTLEGVVGTQTAAVAKTYTGFTVQAFAQETISADGNTKVVIYYDFILPTLSRGVVDLSEIGTVSTLKLDDTALSLEGSTYDLAAYISQNNVENGEHILTVITQDSAARAVKINVENVSAAEELVAAVAKENVFITLTGNIDATTLTWRGQSGKYACVIENLSGVLDGKGYTLTFMKDNENAFGHNLGFFHTVTKDAVIRNLHVDGKIGYNADGTQCKAAFSRVGIIAFQNSGLIEDCYVTAKVFLSKDATQFGRLVTSVGIVFRNNEGGIMRNLITDLQAAAGNLAPENNPNVYGFAFTNQGGTIEKCITVSSAKKENVRMWMSSMIGTSDISVDFGADYARDDYPKAGKAYDGSDFKNYDNAVNQTDKNRRNCAVFETYDAVLVGNGYGDAYGANKEFLNNQHASITASAAQDWFTDSAAWLFTGNVLTFCGNKIHSLAEELPATFNRGMVEWAASDTATSYSVTVNSGESTTVTETSYDMGAYFRDGNKTSGEYTVNVTANDGSRKYSITVKLVTVSDAAGLQTAAALENAYILLTADIDMLGLAWQDSNPRYLIAKNLESVIDGNGHKIEIGYYNKLANGGNDRANNIGAIGVIAQNAAVKNVVFNCYYGYDTAGTCTYQGAFSRLGVIAYKNSGSIENCYVRAKTYLLKDLILGGLVGPVYINTNTGVMRNLITEMETYYDKSRDKVQAYSGYGFAVSNQSGTIENCVTINKATGTSSTNDTIYYFMSSNIGTTNLSVDFGPESSSENNAPTMDKTNYMQTAKGDTGRTHSAVFLSYDDLLGSANGKTDAFKEDGSFDADRFADVTAETARGWFNESSWTFDTESGTIKLLDTAVYQRQQQQ